MTDAPRRRWAAVAVAATLALTACTSSDDPDASPDVSLGPAASTEAEPDDTGDAGESTTAPDPAPPAGPTEFAAEARHAMEELKAAWEAGDQDRARRIAPSDAVDALFTVAPSGYEIYGCDTGEFETSTCNYRNRGTGSFIVVTADRRPEGWQVATILLTGGD